MKVKLTLSIDREVKKKAKQFARQRDTSISSLVESYLSAISYGEDPLLGLGETPVESGLQDGSENHDRYIYSPE